MWSIGSGSAWRNDFPVVLRQTRGLGQDNRQSILRLWALNSEVFLLMQKAAAGIKKRDGLMNRLTRPERQCRVAGCRAGLYNRECLLLPAPVTLHLSASCPWGR